MIESEAYMTYYAYATGEKTPKPKYVQKKANSETSPKKKLVQSPKGKRLKATAKVPKSGKKKLPTQGLETLLEIALSDAKQMKISTKRGRTQFHVSHASGFGAHERTGLTPGVLNTESDNDGDDFVHPKLSTFDEEERHEEKQDEEEEGSDLRVQTPSHFESTDDEAYDDVTQGDNVKEEKLDEDKTNEEEEVDEYSDVNINLEGRDTEMTKASLANVQATQLIEETHVIMTVFAPKVQQQSSSVSSGFISNMLNPNPDTGIDSILNLNTESTFLVDVPVITNLKMPHSSITTLPLPPIPIIQPQQQTPLLTPTLVPTKTSHAVAENLSELKLKKILIDKWRVTSQSTDQFNRRLYKALINAYETDKFILDTYGDTIMIKRYRDDVYDEEEPFIGSNQGSKRRRARKEPASTSEPKEKTSKPTGKSKEGNLAWKEDTRDLFNELIDTPLNFSAFVMNRLKVDTLTLELLAGPTFKLMKGSCKSLVELEYFLEEVYKATTDQLNWNDPEGHQYPHDLRKPLPLIPNSEGRRVIPIDHFINNNLAYLRGGSSSRTYATSVTKTKAADYGHIKWIEDLVSIRRDNEKIYTFKEGDYKRLHLQDIKDMLLLLVQGKLTNLTIEERLALNVSLQMFTKSIVIQRRIEDLQLGVKSYQKKLNLTSPDTYISDLKRLPTYSVYPNPRGFIS
nr:hypothetical protein [Tanacetum cinerariifolium]